MILFMVVKEIRRISKPPKRKPLLLPKRHENQTCVETFKRPPNSSSKTYLNKTFSKQSNHFSQYKDPVYHEIDESVELMQIPDSTDLPSAFGDGNLPKFINNLTRKTLYCDNLNAQTSEFHVLPSTEAHLHLKPAFVPANIEVGSKRDTHSYIDVTGLY